jgi:Domain of unknown function (DUF4390)
MSRLLSRFLALLTATLLALLLAAAPARAQGVDAVVLALEKQEGQLTLGFSLRTQLPRSVEDALQRGVPMYFTAQATLFRSRWYWRDERLARVSRQWRLAYQPLTGSWRVGIGALTQSLGSLPEALSLITRTSGWRLAELSQLDPDSQHYVEFVFRLDTSQLPPPMLVGLTGNSEWQLSYERTLRVE